jgi:hypothetical protein
MTRVDTLGVARGSGSGAKRQGRRIRLGFRLHASGTDAGVDALLECADDRWVAILTHGGRTQTGLGASARTALTVALESLAPRSAAALLADPELFAVSWRLRQAV